MSYNSKYKGAEVESLLDKVNDIDLSLYASRQELNEGLNDKQDTITDLDAIREGASKGATALQSVPSEYITESELESKGYATTAMLDDKVDKVTGKQLSTEDFTSVLKTKLESLNNYDDTAINNAITTLRGDFDKLVSGDTTTAIKTFNEVIAFLEGISDSQDLAGIIASIEQQIAGKMDKINLATVATSGSYNDLSNKPTIPSAVTETTVSGWGFTKNTGTITGIKMNGASKGTSGVVDLGTVITSHQDISGKQDKLISGNNIKTINGQSILGEGDITIKDDGGASVHYLDFDVADLESLLAEYGEGETPPYFEGDYYSLKEAVEKGQIIVMPKDKNNHSLGGYVVGTTMGIANGMGFVEFSMQVGEFIYFLRAGGIDLEDDNFYAINAPAAHRRSIDELVTENDVNEALGSLDGKYAKLFRNTGYVQTSGCLYEDVGGYLFLLPTEDTDDMRDFADYVLATEEYVDAKLNEKQDKLTSGTNIKTINNQSILGSGNITIKSGNSLTESDIAAMGFTKNTGTYSKPSSGIPKTDLASAVQTSLGKADTALQSYTEQYKGTITGVSANGTSVSTSGVANIPAASTSAYGVTKLTSATNSTSTTLAATASAVKAAYDLANGKQDKLTSGTNIKTINNTSLLGSGNIAVQATLVSGTNIKTINGQSILGSGNISISGGTADLGNYYTKTEVDALIGDVNSVLESIINGGASGKPVNKGIITATSELAPTYKVTFEYPVASEVEIECGDFSITVARGSTYNSYTVGPGETIGTTVNVNPTEDDIYIYQVIISV